MGGSKLIADDRCSTLLPIARLQRIDQHCNKPQSTSLAETRLQSKDRNGRDARAPKQDVWELRARVMQREFDADGEIEEPCVALFEEPKAFRWRLCIACWDAPPRTCE